MYRTSSLVFNCTDTRIESFQGVAVENIFAGTYYPAISLYKNATVSTVYRRFAMMH